MKDCKVYLIRLAMIRLPIVSGVLILWLQTSVAQEAGIRPELPTNREADRPGYNWPSDTPQTGNPTLREEVHISRGEDGTVRTFVRQVPIGSIPFGLPTGAVAYPFLPGNDKQSAIYSELAKLKNTSDEKQRSELIQAITKLTGEQFDSLQKSRDTELKLLEDDLNKRRDLLKLREREKDALVCERVQTLVRQAEGLDWNETTYGPSSSVLGDRLSEMAFSEPRLTAIPDTYDPPSYSLPPVVQSLSIKFFSVKHADAKALTEILSNLLKLPNTPLRIEADARTNTIIVYGVKCDFEKIETILARLDQDSRQTKSADLDDPDCEP